MVISKIVTTLDYLVEIEPCCLVSVWTESNSSSSLNNLQRVHAEKTLVWVNSAKEAKISMNLAVPKPPQENLHKCDQNSVMTCNV